MKRQYQPELRDIPLTFLDCNHFLGKMFVEQVCGVLFAAGCQDEEEMLCKNARDGGYCPRDYP